MQTVPSRAGESKAQVKSVLDKEAALASILRSRAQLCKMAAMRACTRSPSTAARAQGNHALALQASDRGTRNDARTWAGIRSFLCAYTTGCDTLGIHSSPTESCAPPARAPIHDDCSPARIQSTTESAGASYGCSKSTDDEAPATATKDQQLLQQESENDRARARGAARVVDLTAEDPAETTEPWRPALDPATVPENARAALNNAHDALPEAGQRPRRRRARTARRRWPSRSSS